MAYGTEAMIPVEVKVPSFRYESFNEAANDSLLAAERDMIEERREVADGSLKATNGEVLRL